MNYPEIYDKLIALSKDSSTTPSERHTAKAKAVQIKKKYLTPSKPLQSARSKIPRFKDAKRAGSQSPFHDGVLRNMQNQFYGPGIGSGIFNENPELKEQLKQAIFGVIKERDELKRKGEL